MGGMSHCPYLDVSKLSHAVGQSVVPWQYGTCLKFSDKVLSFPWRQGANGVHLRLSKKIMTSIFLSCISEIEMNRNIHQYAQSQAILGIGERLAVTEEFPTQLLVGWGVSV